MGLTQADVATQLGVSLNPVQTIERGASKRVTTTIRAYARLAGWTPKSVDTVLDGGEPEMRPAASKVAASDASTAADQLAALPARVVQALTEDGQLLEAVVMNIREQGGAKAVIVIKGAPDATAEEIAKDLDEWSRKEMILRRIVPPDINGGDAAAEA